MLFLCDKDNKIYEFFEVGHHFNLLHVGSNIRHLCQLNCTLKLPNSSFAEQSTKTLYR